MTSTQENFHTILRQFESVWPIFFTEFLNVLLAPWRRKFVSRTASNLRYFLTAWDSVSPFKLKNGSKSLSMKEHMAFKHIFPAKVSSPTSAGWLYHNDFADVQISQKMNFITASLRQTLFRTDKQEDLQVFPTIDNFSSSPEQRYVGELKKSWIKSSRFFPLQNTRNHPRKLELRVAVFLETNQANSLFPNSKSSPSEHTPHQNHFEFFIHFDKWLYFFLG